MDRQKCIGDDLVFGGRRNSFKRKVSSFDGGPVEDF